MMIIPITPITPTAPISKRTHRLRALRSDCHVVLVVLIALGLTMLAGLTNGCIAVKDASTQNGQDAQSSETAAASKGEAGANGGTGSSGANGASGANGRAKLATLPSKPSVQMSDEIVRSEVGDMVSTLPAAWFLVNTKTTAPQAVFAVASNPDYTLGVAYSALYKEVSFDQIFQKDGIAGIAKASIVRRERRNPAMKKIGEAEEVLVGAKRFGLYRYTTDKGATVNRVAVFRSALGNFYECTVTEFPFTGRKIPAREESEQIFTSILAAIDY
jgi:hypothetical protein